MSENYLKVSNLTSSYGDFVVSGIDFKLTSGDVMGLVGSSGAGKSMCVKTILGLKEKDEGSIELRKGENSLGKMENQGYSPQENSLYDFLSVQENMRTFGRLRGLSKTEISDRSSDILERLSIEGSKEKKVKDLSVGMKKRADIAVSLLHEPQLLILDEPFTGLDPNQRDIIWDVISDLSEAGKIVIITSHLIDDVAEECSEYGLIHHGDYYQTEGIKSMMKEAEYDEIQDFLKDSFRV